MMKSTNLKRNLHLMIIAKKIRYFQYEKLYKFCVDFRINPALIRPLNNPELFLTKVRKTDNDIK